LSLLAKHPHNSLNAAMSAVELNQHPQKALHFIRMD